VHLLLLLWQYSIQLYIVLAVIVIAFNCCYSAVAIIVAVKSDEFCYASEG